MRIYISGPISGHDDYRQNFDDAEAYLRAAGYKVVNPAHIPDILPETETTWEQYMTVDAALLTFCDAIYMLRGWYDSEGAMLEYTWALHSGKTILFEEGKYDSV